MSGLLALRLVRGGEQFNVEILRALAFDNQTSNFTVGDTVTGMGVGGTGTLTGTTIAPDDTVTIGTVTYKFVASPAVANDIDVGVSDSVSLDNLIAAINLAAGAGTKYGTGTVVNPHVTAAAGAGDTMDVESKTADGVATATTASLTSGAWGNTTLQGGILASGANGILAEQSDAGASGTLQLRDVEGEFTDNEEISNGASADGLVASVLAVPVLTPADSMILQVDAVDILKGEAIEMLSKLRAKIVNMGWHNGSGFVALRIDNGEFVGDVEELGALAFDGQGTNFTVGHLISAAAGSLATGTLVEQTDGGASGTIIMKDIVGAFVNNDVLTDEGTGDGDSTGTQTCPLLTPADQMILQMDAVEISKSEALEMLRQIRNTVYAMDWPFAA